MATQDPMCWQAWQTDPNAMWNWNGLYKEQVNNNHQAAVPDGQLCSGGLTSDGRYRAMDVPGDWKATNINNSFTLKYHDQARHGVVFQQGVGQCQPCQRVICRRCLVGAESVPLRRRDGDTDSHRACTSS
jgi:hypothetical protein